ncbi:hypothetical protein KP509_01G110800 [Ceratopteris richardii]|uniref:trans-cinnamate 4-monooxygenase n=1 Tax=Ceratopteris richardii TaxID=49495 RepID=A0A8T2VT08_CERRI|nr:hypothetical protein KP509_01G110800 [Ceratopteris richardii]
MFCVVSDTPFSVTAISVETCLLSFLAVVLVVLLISHLSKPKLRLPPAPYALPIIGNWLQAGHNYNHENLSCLSKKYGEIFLLRMGKRNIVIVSSPQLAKEVLHTQGVEFGSRTCDAVLEIFTGKGQDMVFTVYGDHWRKMRRIMTVPFFTSKVVQQNRAYWEQEIDNAMKDLRNHPAASTTGVVVRQRLQMLMYNNVYRILFNRRFEKEDDPILLELKRLNGERSGRAETFDNDHGDSLPVFGPFLRRYLKKCEEMMMERRHFFYKYFIEEHKKRIMLNSPVNEDKCALDHMLDAQKNGEMTEDNIFYVVENINSAAVETTLRTLEWGLAEIVNNPEIQKKIREEMDTVLGKGVPITEPDVSSLPYLHAVLKETMRLHMPVPLLLPHMNLQHEKLGGYDIPAKSEVVVNAWWLANNPEWWEKPEEFHPERFLGPQKMDVNGNDFRFIPFGVGRRSCPGIILAIPIASLVLGRLVQSFELLPPPGQNKVDLTGKWEGGQFSFHLAKHSIVVCKPIS